MSQRTLRSWKGKQLIPLEEAWDHSGQETLSTPWLWRSVICSGQDALHFVMDRGFFSTTVCRQPNVTEPTAEKRRDTWVAAEQMTVGKGNAARELWPRLESNEVTGGGGKGKVGNKTTDASWDEPAGTHWLQTFPRLQRGGIWSSQGWQSAGAYILAAVWLHRKKSTHTVCAPPPALCFQRSRPGQLSSLTLTGLVPTCLLRWENVRRHYASQDSTSKGIAIVCPSISEKITHQ